MLFVCDCCGCVDHHDLAPNYLSGGQRLCSLCHPDSRKWHGHFPREKYDPSKHSTVTNRANGIGFG